MQEETTKYLCLVYVDEKQIEALSPAESQALDDENLGYDAILKKGGHFPAAQALEPSSRKAATIRIRGGKASITDGPNAEHVGGFILIDARDLNEALDLASKIPVTRFGAIEVRAIKKVKGSWE